MARGSNVDTKLRVTGTTLTLQALITGDQQRARRVGSRMWWGRRICLMEPVCFSRADPSDACKIENLDMAPGLSEHASMAI